MKYNYIIILLIFLGCGQNRYKEYYPNGKLKIQTILISNKPEGLFEEYYENGNLKLSGYYENGLKEGRFLEYNPDGSIYGISNYKLGKLEGESIGYTLEHPCEKYFEFYVRGYMKHQLVLDTCLNDTVFHSLNGYNKLYDLSLGKKYLVNVSYYRDSIKLGEIRFDSIGKISRLILPINFLNRSDSFYFNRDYPDWQEQVREWENKKEGK